MKLSTNTILIIFGILALGMMAMFPISLVAAQVLGRQPDRNPQTDCRSHGHADHARAHAECADPNPYPAHADRNSGDQHACADSHTASRGDTGHVL